MTLHNSRLMCLPATLLLDGAPCELCVGRIPWQGVRHACYRGSTAGSAALATSLVVNRARGSFRVVDRYLAVSGFIRGKHIEAGLPAARIAVKENFVWSAAQRKGAGDHYLFLGRLAREKGLDTLLTVWRAMPDLPPLVVAGDGPDASSLERTAPSGVRFLGSVPAAEVPALIAGARAVLLPSRVPEGAVPRAVLEAYASGVGVIASEIGGVPEGVRHGASGLLVAPDDVKAWVGALRQLTADDESVRLGEGARALWASRYAPEIARQAIERHYEAACGDALSA
jgi:glycosyltransferase involved in cell wall biosynthesis